MTCHQRLALDPALRSFGRPDPPRPHTCSFRVGTERCRAANESYFTVPPHEKLSDPPLLGAGHDSSLSAGQDAPLGSGRVLLGAGQGPAGCWSWSAGG